MLNRFLENHRRVYLDSMIFIYQLAKDARYSLFTNQLLQAIENKKMKAVCSSLLFAETLVPAFRANRIDLAEQTKLLFLSFPNLEILPVTNEISTLSAQIRAEYNFKTPDALHLATAFVSGCKIFITNDKALQKVRGIEVFVLDSALES